MRIILTQLGDNTLKKLAEEDRLKKQKEQEELNYQKRIEMKMKMTRKDSDLKNLSAIHKEVNIKQKIIPKIITDKYNSDSRTNSILPQMNMSKNSEKDNEEMNYTNKMNLSLREIFQKSTLEDLKDRLVSEKRIKDRLSRIDETKFRSSFQDKSLINKIDEKLDHEIKPDKVNLIKYLKSKEKVSDKFIERLSNIPEFKENKINKICQVIFYNHNNENIFNQTIRQNMQIMKNKEKVEYKLGINQIGKSMKSFNDILKKYPDYEKNRKRFEEAYNDVKKNYWKKFNVERLERTKWQYINQNTSLSETTHNFSKFINTSELK